MITIALVSVRAIPPDSLDAIEPGAIWYIAAIELLLIDTPVLGWLILNLVRVI